MLHKWSKWEQYQQLYTRVYPKQNKEYEYAENKQRKTCEVCGKVKVETIYD